MTSSARTVRVERVMGTAVTFDLRGRGDRDAALDAAVARLHEIDARFSTWRAGSEVGRYGRGEVADHERSADLVAVMTACDRVHRASGGAFDVRAAGGFDPSALVKGWSVDQAGAILEEHGCTDWSINAGGDVLVSAEPTSAPWRIGVQHPSEPGALAAVLHARRLAVATSARYLRGDHLIDPRTGRPADGAVSTTVCGPRLGEADALSTAAFVLGEQGPAWIAAIDGWECCSVLPGGRVLATAGFPRTVHGVPVSTIPASSHLGAVA